MLKKIGEWIPDLLMIAGAAAVSVAFGMEYLPAGIAVAGLFLIGAGYLAAKGAR